MDIYVGNLAYTATEDDIKEAFEQFGAVENVKVVMDRVTGRPRGFAFVTMGSDEDGSSAVEGMDGAEIKGRKVKVDQARPKQSGPRSY